ncbi:MAG: spermidine/putrescine ABC transporter substrate-binding protein [Candidatus Nanopelagicales bacterium]
MTDTNEFSFPVAAVRETGLSRRDLLRGIGAGGAAVAGGSLLAACGNDSGSSSGDTSGDTSTDMSDADKVLNFANWQLYIDQKRGVDGEKSYPTIEGFEAETGIDVNYTEPINDNESYFAQIRPRLLAGSDIGQDAIVMTDFMAARLIQLGFVQTLDKSNIPNAKNITEKLQHPSFDPEREYSIPWQSGVTGIAYDAGQVDPVNSVSDLLTNPELSGSMTVLTEMRDTMGLIMLDQGNDPEDFDVDAWNQAMSVLTEALDSNHIRQFTGNNYAQLLAKGDLKACMAWSGDVIQLQFDNPDIVFVVPDAGAILWSDNMLVPNQAQHKKNAELWMNYYYEPKVAAQLAAWVNYICPVAGAKEEMEKLDPDLANNPLIFPSDEDYAKLSIFRALTDAENQQFTQEFQALYA